MHRYLLPVVLVAAAVVLLAPVAQAGSPPSIAWTPSPGAYGTVQVGESVSRTFTLTNSGGSATGALVISLSGSSAFTKTADACTAVSLGPKKTCQITVSYSPSAAGSSDTATLSAVSKKPAASASITLTGSGAVQPPALTVTKDNDANHDGTYSDTETAPVDAVYPWTVTYRVTITNSSASSAATITAISDDRVAAPLRSASTTDVDCADVISNSIASGATLTCYYNQIFFNPSAVQFANTVTVTAANNGGSDTKSDTSTANFPQPHLDLGPPAVLTNPDQNSYIWELGVVRPGDVRTQSFVVTNTGVGSTGTLVVACDATHTVCPNTGPLTLADDTCTGTGLAPGATCGFVVTATVPSTCFKGQLGSVVVEHSLVFLDIRGICID